jgi:hypothetical protein
MAGSAVQEIGQRQDRLARFGLTAGALLLAALSASNIAGEFATHKMRIAGAMGPYASNPANLAPMVASLEAIYDKLEVCDGALGNLATLLQPPDLRAQTAQQCLRFAEAVLRGAPGMSLAHLVRAAALQETGDASAARQALLLSAYTAGDNIPNALRRANLWVRQFADLTPQEQAALRKDIIRIAAKNAGTDWLAGQYILRPELQPLLAEVIQTLPDARQRAFLAALRERNSQ